MSIRFQVLSDLHIDSYARRGLPIGDIPVTDCDAVLIAGDIANSDFAVNWLTQQSEKLGKPMFIITGNHEYFGEDVTKFDQKFDDLLAQRLTNITFLQQKAVDFMGVRLLGCTLWTDYQYQATKDTLPTALAFMQDYRSIVYAGGLFNPEDSIKLHWQQREWLQAELIKAEQDGVPTVVMTHHAISPNSVSEKYADMASNAGFVTDLSEWLVQSWSPKLWVHGHTHEAFDYVQGNTHVVVNPRAYPTEVSSTGLVFDWAKVVAVNV